MSVRKHNSIFCYIGTVILIALHFTMNSHAAISDTIQQELRSISEESQVSRLVELARENSMTDPNKSVEYARASIGIARELHNDSILCSAYISVGAALRDTGNYVDAQKHLDSAYRIAEQRNYSLVKGVYHRLSGSIRRHQGDVNAAFDQYQQAAKIFESLKDSVELAKLFNGMGVLFNGGYSVDYPKALSLFRKSKNLFSQLKDSTSLSVVLVNMSHAFQGVEEYDSAIYYSKLNIEWLQRQDMRAALAWNFKVLSKVYMLKGELKEALKHSNKALRIAKELKNIPVTITALQHASSLCLSMNMPEKTIEFAQEALELCIATKSRSKRVYCYYYLYSAYEKMDKIDMAYKNLKLYSKLKDSLINEEKAEQLAEMETKYEAEKKDAEIELLTIKQKLSEQQLERRNQQQLMLFGFIVLLTLFFTYIFFTYRSRQRLKEKLLESELQELRGKITGLLEDNPDALDFSFESLNEKLGVPLSKREFEVLLLVMNGLENKEIANELFITIHTVKFHLSNIYEKLGVTKRKDALKFVVSSSK